ncbi:lipopolysaccharide biosynthesis protein [Agrococcus citreus]|uniref:Membrane protein involved in the export of O-antigen and teichoic acid n=1 Tax=Agrococcus citreus TaxID=84643 RepID=A0ABN1YTH2_9MICO
MLRLFSGLVAARLLGAVAQAALLFLLARLLDPVEFGVVGAILGAMILASTLSDLGITPATTRSSAVADRPVVFALQRLNFRVAWLSGLTMTLIISVAALTLPSVFSWSLLPLAIWIFTERVAEFRFALAIGAERVRRATANLSVRKVFPTVLTSVALLTPIDPIFLMSCGFALGGLLSLLLPVDTLEPEASGEQEVGSSLGATLRHALPFWLNSVGAQARQLDVTVVGIVSNFAVAGVFAPAARLISPLRLIPATLGQAALPRAARAGGRKSPWQLTFSVGLASVGVYAAIALLAEPLIRVLFGEPYIGAAPVLQVLLLGLVAAGMSSVLTSHLQASGREWSVAKISLLTAAVSLILLAILAQLYGPVAAAGGLTLGYFIQFGLLAWLSPRPRKTSANSP